jgi:hypothetical protein
MGPEGPPGRESKKEVSGEIGQVMRSILTWLRMNTSHHEDETKELTNPAGGRKRSTGSRCSARKRMGEQKKYHSGLVKKRVQR